MGLTEADARVFLTEGMLSADLEDHEEAIENFDKALQIICLLYTSPSPRDGLLSRMPSSA